MSSRCSGNALETLLEGADDARERTGARLLSVAIQLGVAKAHTIVPVLKAPDPDSIFALTDVVASGLLFLVLALAVAIALQRAAARSLPPATLGHRYPYPRTLV